MKSDFGIERMMDEATQEPFDQLSFLNEKSIRLTIPGRPVPAVRMTQKSKYVSKQAGRYLAYKNTIGWIAKKQGIKRLEVPVEVIAVAYIHGLREPDVDNLAKAFLDGLNGLAWNDDRQVRRLIIEKIKVDTAKEERAEILIKEI